MTDYGQCANCGGTLTDGEMLRGELCDSCRLEQMDWTDYDDLDNENESTLPDVVSWAHDRLGG